MQTSFGVPSRSLALSMLCKPSTPRDEQQCVRIAHTQRSEAARLFDTEQVLEVALLRDQ